MRIHQALHGYERGHRLLAASIPLPPAASVQLLDLTDANDVEEDASFPSVIAGFPLSGTGFFAVSKTWPAEHANRVGSVRTHTLLLDLDALRLLSPVTVLKVFARSLSVRRAHFERPVEVGRTRSERRENPPKDLAKMLWALYEAPIRPVIAVLDDIDPNIRQYLLLRLLFQQGPALGGMFAFAEAPRWARRIGNQPFDLHVTGKSGVSDLRQGVGEARLVTRRIESAPPPWAELACAELGAPRGFDTFVQRWASNLPGGRADFPTLVEIWAEHQRDSEGFADLGRLLRLVDKAFPRRGEMAELKAALFGAPPVRVLTPSPDPQVLKVLAGAPSARCLSIPDMHIGARTEAVFAESTKEGLEVLFCIDDIHMTEMAKAIAAASLPWIPARELAEIARKRPRLWAMLLTMNPAVASGTEFGNLSQANGTAVLKALKESDGSPAIRRRSIAALAIQAPSQWRKRLQKEFLDEVEANPADFISGSSDLEPWAPSLSRDAIAGWLNEGNPTASDVLRAASYFTSKVAGMVAPDRWLMAVDALPDADSSTNAQGLVTLLAVAIKAENPPADLLAIRVLDQLWSTTAELPKNVLTDLQSLSGEKETSPRRILMSLVSDGFRKSTQWRPAVALELSSDRTLKELLEADSRRGSRSSSISYRLAQELPIPGMSSTQYDVLQQNLAKHAKRDDLLGMLESVVRRVTGL